MADFSKIPAAATLDVKPFKAHVDDAKLKHFKDLLKLSPIGPAVFENTNAERKFGMRRDWLTEAKKFWETEYDWHKCENRVNSFPNFKASVKDTEDNTIEVQFLALFSEKSDAVPIAFMHGWPGSILEFLDLLDVLKKRYSPKDLPYHVVVPSLPGYAWSSGPPVDKDYAIDIATGALNNLMVGLGFGSGYLAQGGDIGSFVSRVMASSHDACKGMHVNMMSLPPPPNAAELPLSDLEKKVAPRGEKFFDSGFAYGLEHGTRTATIGLALSSSPLALLSWIGEKFLEWSDKDPSMEQILDSVTLYWLTDTFPRCIYFYRGVSERRPFRKAADGKYESGSSYHLSLEKMEQGLIVMQVASRTPRQIPYLKKPCGYSLFPYELNPIPKSWAEQSCNLVSYNSHESGGHFAAMEVPEVLLADVEEFVKKAWNPTR